MRSSLLVLMGVLTGQSGCIGVLGSATPDERLPNGPDGRTVPTGVADRDAPAAGDADLVGDPTPVVGDPLETPVADGGAPSPADAAGPPVGGDPSVPPGDPVVMDGCAFPPGVPQEGFIAAATAYSDTDPSVDLAVNAVMRELTGCGIGSRCDIVGFAGANADEVCQSWFAAVNERLRQQGYCAGQHEAGVTDEIAVSNTGCAGRWYGYHICNYGGPLVVWNPGARRGWWQISPTWCE